MGGAHEALEHAEHAQHSAHSADPFDKRVAMTMAMVAACLASVSLLSHRGHNETILHQAQASTLHTQASDMWNFYQAKNIRTHEYTAFAALMDSLSKEVLLDEKARSAKAYWQSKAKTYEEKDLPKLKKEAEQLVEKAHEQEHLSHAAHKQVNFFDAGELFIELALVLCSIAVLTKLRSFWMVGIGICLLGVVIAVIPFTPIWARLNPDDESHGHAPPSTAPETPGKGHGSGGH